MTATHAPEISRRLHALADAERARQSAVFLQVAAGCYGEGDQILGITVPDIRLLVREFRAMAPEEAIPLVRSPWHEERLCGYLLWVESWHRASASRTRDEALRAALVALLWEHLDGLNNWDLVDSIAPILPGEWLLEHPDPERIARLRTSPRLWDRRVAVLAEFAAVRAGRYSGMLDHCASLLHDPHDLMHKACGWMLREVGKRDLPTLRSFLRHHATEMPRTMLRYSIEKLEPDERKRWMSRH